MVPFDISTFSNVVPLYKNEGGSFEGFGILSTDGNFVAVEADAMRLLKDMNDMRDPSAL